MKKSLILLFTVVFNLGTFAQKNIQEAHYKFGDRGLALTLSNKLSTVIKAHPINICLKSIVLARFTIEPDGSISPIKFSDTTSQTQAFRTILTEVINSTNGNWVPKVVNNKHVESKPFILPLIFQMEAGCYSSGKNVYNSTDNALLVFFNSENGFGNNTTQLDCVLLKTLNMFSQN